LPCITSRRNASDASRLLQRLEYRWDTKLATQMEAKILGPMAYSRALAKPLLVITITDGEPSDNPQDKIISVIQQCRSRLAPRYGPNAVAFQFAQVCVLGEGAMIGDWKLQEAWPECGVLVAENKTLQ
jgi:hypothetical protein